MTDQGPAPKRNSYHVGNLPDLLLQAAREILNEEGLLHLSLRKVATRVGVSANAAYRHYINRSDLLKCLAAEGFNELHSTILQRIHEVPSVDCPREAALAYFSFAQANPNLYQLMFAPELAVGGTSTPLLVATQAARKTLESTIANAMGVAVQEPCVTRAAFSAWSLVHGFTSIYAQRLLPIGIIEDELQLPSYVIAGILDVVSLGRANKQE